MASHVSNLVHFVWGTAGRRALIRDSWRDRLHGYFGGVLRNKNGTLLRAGSIEDHVHVYASLPATVTLAEVANAMKANSSRWVHEDIGDRRFRWQEGYGAFTVSKSSERRVMQYVENQAENHQERTFQEEFVALLQKHGIQYDERYLWT